MAVTSKDFRKSVRPTREHVISRRDRAAIPRLIVALTAQNLRDSTGSRLAAIDIVPYQTLRTIERYMAEAARLFEAHYVMLLREAIEAEGPPVPVNAALLLYDVCNVLEFDEAQTQYALSLADWSDVQQLLSQQYGEAEVNA